MTIQPQLLVRLEQAYAYSPRQGANSRGHTHLRVVDHDSSVWLTGHTRLARSSGEPLCRRRHRHHLSTSCALVPVRRLCPECLRRAFRLRLFVPGPVTVDVRPDMLPQVKVLKMADPDGLRRAYHVLGTGGFGGPLGVVNSVAIGELSAETRELAMALVRSWYHRDPERLLSVA